MKSLLLGAFPTDMPGKYNEGFMSGRRIKE